MTTPTSEDLRRSRVVLEQLGAPARILYRLDLAAEAVGTRTPMWLIGFRVGLMRHHVRTWMAAGRGTGA